jgi:restriction endonuclease S subunit
MLLIKQNKIPAEKPVNPAKECDFLPVIPKNWSLTRFGEISNKIQYGYTASADHTNKKVRLIRITDIQNSQVIWDTVPGCEIDDSNYPSYAIGIGDLLIARTGGTIGKSYLVRDIPVPAVFASYLIRIVPNKNLDPEYVKLFADSPTYWNQLYEKCMGTGQPNVNGTSLRSLIVPLPPLAEQHRIVAKVDALMALCDALESRLKVRAGVQSKFTDSVVMKVGSE